MNHIDLIIHFDHLEEDLSEVDLYIYLEHLSEADAPSRIVAQYPLKGVSIASAESNARVRLETADLSTDDELSVRVHADVDRSGSMSPGDYLTTSQTLVPPLPHSGPLTVHLQKI